jgi:ubiquitin-protein ligase
MEYRMLQKFAPVGVFVVPSTRNSLSEWHGVYLVKQGIYNGAILKFVIEFPIGYPRMAPEVRF